MGGGGPQPAPHFPLCPPPRAKIGCVGAQDRQLQIGMGAPDQGRMLEARCQHRGCGACVGPCPFPAGFLIVYSTPLAAELLRPGLRASLSLAWPHWGFVFPCRSKFNKKAAERHWELLHALFDRTLKN